MGDSLGIDNGVESHLEFKHMSSTYLQGGGGAMY